MFVQTYLVTRYCVIRYEWKKKGLWDLIFNVYYNTNNNLIIDTKGFTIFLHSCWKERNCVYHSLAFLYKQLIHVINYSKPYHSAVSFRKILLDTPFGEKSFSLINTLGHSNQAINRDALPNKIPSVLKWYQPLIKKLK